MLRDVGFQSVSPRSHTSASDPGLCGKRAVTLLLIVVMCLAIVPGCCQPSSARDSTSLADFSDSLARITSKVTRCVVTLVADTYITEDEIDQEVVRSDAEHADTSDNGLLSSNNVIGSGLIVSPDGYIVTNAHVVFGARRLRVILYPQTVRQREMSATIVGIDRLTDLAVLRISMAGLPFLSLDDFVEPRQGEISLAFGAPLGMERSVSMGIVSAVDRQLEPDDPRLWIQTDAPVNPGNSGGPLVDSRGLLLGINTLIYSDSGHNEGVALAIPAPTVRDVFHDLIRYGRVQRISLGISARNIDSDIASALHLGDERGVLVEDVDQPSPAQWGGVEPGDVLENINGQPVPTIVTLEALLRHLVPGKPITMEVVRGGREQSLHCVPEAAEPAPIPLRARISPATNLVPRLQIFGVSLDSEALRLTGPTRFPYGVVVAARSGTFRIDWGNLQPGDIIYEVNGEKTRNVDELRARLANIPLGGAIVLQIERDRTLHYVEMKEAEIARSQPR
jgi:serine protease Do